MADPRPHADSPDRCSQGFTGHLGSNRKNYEVVEPDVITIENDFDSATDRVRGMFPCLVSVLGELIESRSLGIGVEWREGPR